MGFARLALVCSAALSLVSFAGSVHAQQAWTTLAPPPRPVAPGGAPESVQIPLVDADGIRHTPNSGLAEPQLIWNLRSALNVAALNCLKPEHAGILASYKTLLTRHEAELAAANTGVTRHFAQNARGGNPAKVREAYMTRVYNYFASPSTTPQFCDAALAVSTDLDMVPAGQLKAFAETALPRIEQVFLDFYAELQAYRLAAADWDRTYGATSGPRLASTVPASPAASTAASSPVIQVAISAPSAPVTATAVPASAPAQEPLLAPGVVATVSH